MYATSFQQMTMIESFMSLSLWLERQKLTFPSRKPSTFDDNIIRSNAVDGPPKSIRVRNRHYDNSVWRQHLCVPLKHRATTKGVDVIQAFFEQNEAELPGGLEVFHVIDFENHVWMTP